ncbi:FG-GAP-like repeat-containing protein [Paenarthrobacter nicotinovorans]|uniref:FG-GAP-like repeat-containing protein n=1 Tax=Paenarthrobacter nicotinovorans TaxID=29320 RepID=UPI0011A1E187|nr:FG-GAP-like repeat-containing protein [Paenarthrobacter nicotinovorans]
MTFAGGAGRRLAAGFLALITMATVLVGVAAEPAQADIVSERITAPNTGGMVFNSASNSAYVLDPKGGSITKVDLTTKATTSIPVANYPRYLAVNKKTNKIYVAHLSIGSVSVIDGATNITAELASGTSPSSMEVNEATNKIYIAYRDGVMIIDGATNSSTIVPLTIPDNAKMALNSITNKLYVTGFLDSEIAVIDGVTNEVSNIDIGARGDLVVVNDSTNKVYVSQASTHSIVTIDAKNNTVTTVPVEATTIHGMAVNRKTNRVYVTNWPGNSIIALDGATNSVEYLPLSEYNHFADIAVNEATNKVYASSGARNYVSVFDGITGAEGKIPGVGGPRDLAINEATNKIYVADVLGGSVAVINGKNVSPTITSGAPPTTGRIGEMYRFRFTATGSLTPQFKVADGKLPPGLTLESWNPDGYLSGIPTSAGIFTFRIAVTNTYAPDAVSPPFTITVKPDDIRHDFTGDRNPDVLSRDGYGNLWLYPGQGNGGWLPRLHVGVGWNVMTSIVAPGDFNGDGRADLLAQDGSGILWLYPGNGRGGWLQRVQVGQGWTSMSAVTAVGDLNLDGAADLVARDPDGYLWLYPGSGAGGWLERSRLSNGWQVLTALVGSGDFDGDGNVDLLATDAGGTLRLYSGSVARYDLYTYSSFHGPTQVGYGWNAMTAIVGPGDFNGDGNVDLLARDAGGALWLYPSNGQGGWLPRGMVGSGWNTMNLII